jgi:FMN phosphatase YigB (HAD superfamily)
MKIILVDAVYTLVSETGDIFQEMRELLDTYDTRKIILTGAPYKKFPEYHLDTMPYDVFTLEHDPPKTKPEYYIRMLDHYSLHSDDVVYFEHAEEAVLAARSVGICTYHYDALKRELGKLKRFLDENV